MKNRSMIFRSAFMAVVLAACFTLTTCQSLRSVVREPKVSLKSVDFRNISFTGIDLLCKVNVVNPNAFTIPFPELDWELLINANHFINGTIKNDKSIKSRSTTVVEVPVRLNYIEAFNTFRSLSGSTEADYKIPLDLKFNLPVLGEKVFHLEPKGTIPLFQIPSVSFKGISSIRTTFNPLPKLDFDVSWEVENKNGVAMLVNDISYNLSVNNNQWAAGSVPKDLRINPKQKQTITFSGSLSSSAVVSSIASIRGKDVTYLCAGNFDVGLDFPGFKNYALPFNFSGSTRL